MQTQIRLLPKEQSDQDLNCLAFHLHHLGALLYCKTKQFYNDNYGNYFRRPNSNNVYGIGPEICWFQPAQVCTVTQLLMESQGWGFLSRNSVVWSGLIIWMFLLLLKVFKPKLRSLAHLLPLLFIAVEETRLWFLFTNTSTLYKFACQSHFKEFQNGVVVSRLTASYLRTSKVWLYYYYYYSYILCRVYMFCVMFCTVCVFMPNKAPALGERRNWIEVLLLLLLSDKTIQPSLWTLL